MFLGDEIIVENININLKTAKMHESSYCDWRLRFRTHENDVLFNLPRVNTAFIVNKICVKIS